MTLQTPTTGESAATMPAPEIPEPMAEEIPLVSKGFTGRTSLPQPAVRSLSPDDFVPIPIAGASDFQKGIVRTSAGSGISTIRTTRTC